MKRVLSMGLAVFILGYTADILFMRWELHRIPGQVQWASVYATLLINVCLAAYLVLFAFRPATTTKKDKN